MTPLSDEAIEMVRANYITVQDEPEKVEVKEPKKVVKTDADYRPEEMIPCRSLFAGVLLFTGDHTHMTYAFNGAGDRRNIEYQDLKAAMLQHKGSIEILPMDHIQPKLALTQNLLSNLIAHLIKTRLSIIYNLNQVKRHNLNQPMNSIILKQITDENTDQTIL